MKWNEMEKSIFNAINRIITLNKDFSAPLRFARNDVWLFREFVILSWIVCHIAKFLLNSHELVILADTVGT